MNTQDIHETIHRRYQARALFYSHIGLFLLANGFIWITMPGALSHYEGGSFLLGVVMMLTVGWLIGLVLHRQQFIAVVRQHETVKPKRKPKSQFKPEIPMQLSNDGELPERYGDENHSIRNAAVPRSQ